MDVVATEPGLGPVREESQDGLGITRQAPSLKVAVAGGVVLVLLTLASYVAPLPHDPLTPQPYQTLQGPSGAHWFGTDKSGFDVFSQVIEAARSDLPLAVGGTLGSMLLGVVLGLAVSQDGWLSRGVMRAVDIFQCFPLLVLAVALVSLAGNSLIDVIYAIAVISVPRFLRLVRGEALTLRSTRFVEAAIAVGCTRTRILFHHVLPNLSGVVIAQASLASADSIILIASLNYIGVGVTPPNPTWGSMIKEGSADITTGQWWVAVFPGLFVLLSVICLNLIADGLSRRGAVGSEW